MDFDLTAFKLYGEESLLDIDVQRISATNRRGAKLAGDDGGMACCAATARQDALGGEIRLLDAWFRSRTVERFG